MKKETLAKIRQSLYYDYLPKNWNEERKNIDAQLIETASGYVAFDCDCVWVESSENFYHEDLDTDYYTFDEYNHVYIEREDAVLALRRTATKVWTHRDNCDTAEGITYIEECLDDINELQRVHNGDVYRSDNVRWVEEEQEYYYFEDVYFWESDDEYHTEPEPEESDDNTLWAYASGPQEKYFVNEDSVTDQKFGWGIEIEKSEFPSFTFNKQELFDRTGAVIERDGSVSNGFELKTPVYNLFSPKTDERLLELEQFCNIKGVQNAGGHIGFSMDGKTDIELLNLCRGFLPLIYAMYKNRVTNSYCYAKKIPNLIRDRSKMQAIRLRDNYLEFRVFSSVKSFYTIQFRLQLFRIIAKNLGASFSKVLDLATKQGTELNTLLTSKVYNDEAKLERLITDAMEMQKSFGSSGRILSEKTLEKIQIRIKEQFKKRNLGE